MKLTSVWKRQKGRSQIAKIFNRLEAKSKKIDDNDILIAGIMLSNGVKKIISKNGKYFERIQGIEVLTY